jgi:hypothetical protein
MSDVNLVLHAHWVDKGVRRNGDLGGQPFRFIKWDVGRLLRRLSWSQCKPVSDPGGLAKCQSPASSTLYVLVP